jgi:hypothetical protein
MTAVGLLALASCTNEHRIERLARPSPGGIAQLRIPVGARVLVTCPQDGAYGAKSYAGSGASVQRAAVGALSQHGIEPLTGPLTEDSEQAIGAGRVANAAWVVVPRIVEWEDRAAEWSARPDRLRVELRTFATATGQLVESTSITGRGKVITLGGDHPQDMLLPALGEWAGGITRTE